MLTKRIIACLDVKDGRVVKGVQFRNHVDMGDILELSQRYADEGVDELVFYDITASSDGRVVDKSWVNQIAHRINIPFCVAGGIRTIADAKAILNDLLLFDFIETYQQDGLLHALCTDIDRDGTLTGCNRDLYKEVKEKYPNLQLQASGGVSTLADLDGLTSNGVIIGKALYEGRFTVAQALEAVAC